MTVSLVVFSLLSPGTKHWNEIPSMSHTGRAYHIGIVNISSIPVYDSKESALPGNGSLEVFKELI